MTPYLDDPIRAQLAVEALKAILSIGRITPNGPEDCLQKSSFEAVRIADSLLEELKKLERENFPTTLNKPLSDVKAITMDVLDNIERIYENQIRNSGLSTGFSDLDSITDGLHPGEMIVIASRPAVGKTSFALNIVEHVALKMNMPVVVFSLEMSSQQVVQRLLCSGAKLSIQRIRAGHINQPDFERLTKAATVLAESKLLIDDAPNLSILDLQAKCRKLKAQHDIQLIVVDYLQLLWSPSRRGQENRQLEISDISRSIKALAKELEVPIVAISQLNRNPELRVGGKPRLSDLRESGSIEQDADLVCLLSRAELYEEDDDFSDTNGKAELIIAKHRNGPIGELPLTFFKEFTRFESRGGLSKEIWNE